jgi:glutathione S-transferase
MQLIGMLDSPYVRRVAISMHLMEIPFEHRPISVFSTFAEFARINPLVKAPTLVCDDGEVLMDSGLILQFLQACGPARSLLPVDRPALQHALRIIGLALAACEKTVQIVYERNLRPPEKQHEPWIDRIAGQLAAAYAALEAELPRAALAVAERDITQAGITTAVAWRFTQMMLPGRIDPAAHPALAGLSEAAEQLAAFRAAPP